MVGYLERSPPTSLPAEAVDKLPPKQQNATEMKVAVVFRTCRTGLLHGDMANAALIGSSFEALARNWRRAKYGIPEFPLLKTPLSMPSWTKPAPCGSLFHTDHVIGKTLSTETCSTTDSAACLCGFRCRLPRLWAYRAKTTSVCLSSNEYLTPHQPYGAGRQGYDTPAPTGRRVAVVGGGNTAMDSVRTARRMGAERANDYIPPQRGRMPARIEEVHHAKEEGVEFLTLCNPIEYKADRARPRALRGSPANGTRRTRRLRATEPCARGRRNRRNRRRSRNSERGSIAESPYSEQYRRARCYISWNHLRRRQSENVNPGNICRRRHSARRCHSYPRHGRRPTRRSLYGSTVIEQ